jgi:hypothetical protein
MPGLSLKALSVGDNTLRPGTDRCPNSTRYLSEWMVVSVGFAVSLNTKTG